MAIILGTFISFFSFTWKTTYTNFLFRERKNIIENSADYLEIEFEKWLKSKTIKENKKIIIVIDELDKIGIAKAIEKIKEYKNLFTQSKAHFIFIASQEAYEKTLVDRKGDNEDSYIPTFFTHTIYLPLPTRSEIEKYLDEIVADSNIKFSKEIKSYLLFKSKDDFFELKRLLNDIIEFDNENPYINTDLIKDEDIEYNNIVKIYEDVSEWHIGRYLGKFKKNWQKNSEMKDDVFSFLNSYLSISIYDGDITNLNITNLVEDLESWGYLEKKDSSYIWIYKVKRDKLEGLQKQDEDFKSEFEKLIQNANDIDELVDIIKGRIEGFNKYEKIYNPTQDGNTISGIPLFDIYKKYETIYKKINDKFEKKNYNKRSNGW